jgi:hypothetical protein
MALIVHWGEIALGEIRPTIDLFCSVAYSTESRLAWQQTTNAIFWAEPRYLPLLFLNLTWSVASTDEV